MEYSRRPTKSIPKENQLKILNKIYQTYLVSTTPPISNIQVNINGVQKLLSNIKANKATGPDNIPHRSKKETLTMLRIIAPFRSPVSAANFWSTSSVTISMNIWTSTAYYHPCNMASDPAIPVSPNSLSRRLTWASPTVRRNKWTSQSWFLQGLW